MIEWSDRGNGWSDKMMEGIDQWKKWMERWDDGVMDWWIGGLVSGVID